MGASYELSTIKQHYREIFTQACEAFFTQLGALQEHHHCSQCDGQGQKPTLLEPFHSGCGYRAWQQEAISVIENDMAREILTKLKLIDAYKATFQCHMCGVCCRFASSEFSYQELEAKAQAGDSFATQFTSIFLPYLSVEIAQEKFPEIVGAVLAQAGPEAKVHFYHCPYIGEDNRCTIYGSPKRPAICSSYPDTPLAFIYDKCAWQPWKEETHPDALWAHAMIELCADTLGKLKQALTPA